MHFLCQHCAIESHQLLLSHCSPARPPACLYVCVWCRQDLTAPHIAVARTCCLGLLLLCRPTCVPACLLPGFFFSWLFMSAGPDCAASRPRLVGSADVRAVQQWTHIHLAVLCCTANNRQVSGMRQALAPVLPVLHSDTNCPCRSIFEAHTMVCCGMAWRGVVWCGVVWCGVVWCGVVWCGVVWCDVLCRQRECVC